MIKDGSVTIRLIQYVGDKTAFVPRVHGNCALDSDPDYRRTFPSVLKKVKTSCSGDSNPSTTFKRNQTCGQRKYAG